MQVVGTVPDVRPYLGEASVVIVPLLVGGGTRIKIFEAMAMAKPVVSTTVGAEGLKLTPDKHIVLADAPAESESILYAQIDPAAARNKQRIRVPGLHVIDRFADRRPEMYGRITAGGPVRS